MKHVYNGPVHVKDCDLVLVAGPVLEGDDLRLPLLARDLTTNHSSQDWGAGAACFWPIEAGAA